MTQDFIETRHGRFRVDAVVGFFDVWTGGRLPFSHFTLKVVAVPGGFQAIPNVFVRNSRTKCIEYVSGIGESVDAAIVSAIEMFHEEATRQQANTEELDEKDFIWMNWLPYVPSLLDEE